MMPQIIKLDVHQAFVITFLQQILQIIQMFGKIKEEFK